MCRRGAHRRGRRQHAKAAGRGAAGERLRARGMGSAAWPAWAAWAAVAVAEDVILVRRRRFLRLGSLANRPPDEVEQARDRDLQDHREEEDRPESLHRSGSVFCLDSVQQRLDVGFDEVYGRVGLD